MYDKPVEQKAMHSGVARLRAQADVGAGVMPTAPAQIGYIQGANLPAQPKLVEIITNELDEANARLQVTKQRLARLREQFFGSWPEKEQGATPQMPGIMGTLDAKLSVMKNLLSDVEEHLSKLEHLA